MFLGRLALIHTPDDLGLLVVDLLVDLGAPRRLVAVHLGGEGSVVLAGDLLNRLLLAAAVGGVVLVVGRGETVGDAALVLCEGIDMLAAVGMEDVQARAKGLA